MTLGPENFSSKFLSGGDPWSKDDPWRAGAEGRSYAGRVTASGKQSGSGARGPHVGKGRRGGEDRGAGDWSQYKPAQDPPEANRGALGPQGVREVEIGQFPSPDFRARSLLMRRNGRWRLCRVRRELPRNTTLAAGVAASLPPPVPRSPRAEPRWKRAIGGLLTHSVSNRLSRDS